MQKRKFPKNVPIPVVSNAMQTVLYDGKNLDILFRDGDFRSYKDVPERVFIEMMSAGSIGGYFNANIRDAYKHF